MVGMELTMKLGINKGSFPVFLVLANALLWYYLNLSVLAVVAEQLKQDYVVLASFHAVGSIIAALVGLILSKNRRVLWVFWTILGVATSFFPIIDSSNASNYFQFISIVWGFAFGLGMPSCLAYFAEVVSIEKRGRFAGLALMIAFFSAVLLGELARSLGLLYLCLLLGVVRLLGLFPLFGLHVEKKVLNLGKRALSQIYHKRLYMYLIPWFIFNFIDAAEGLLLRDFWKSAFPEYYLLMQLVSMLSIGIFVFLGGLSSDLIGRKPIMVLGFSVMGIAYAIVSIFPSVLFAWFFLSISEGLTLGLFYTLFIAVIWGDLAPKGSEELYYFIGSFPFFLATIAQMFLAGPIRLLKESSAFSFAAIFLFVAVLPILFASETLPEKKMKERELKQYIEKAKKTKEKYV